MCDGLIKLLDVRLFKEKRNCFMGNFLTVISHER